MLEAVFSKNAAGGLAVAQTCGKNTVLNSADIIFNKNDAEIPYEEPDNSRKLKEERNRYKINNAVPVNGRKEDIFCFSNDLSSGDISGDGLSENRRAYLDKFYDIFPDDKIYALNDLEDTKKNLDIIKKRASEGGTVRIWYSNLPYEYCGMCWLITELKKTFEVLP